MLRSIAALILLTATFLIPQISYAQSSDVLNSVLFLRNAAPASGLLPCAKSTKGSQSYCPLVASNCPSSHPVCALVPLRKYSSSTRTYPTCVCTTGFFTNAPSVQPCKAGNTCTPLPIVTPTPRPTATPRPTVTPRPTTTPYPTVTVTPYPTATPAVTLYLEGQNNNTGFIARNGQTLYARVGDSIQYRWGATNAVNGISQYRIVAGQNKCDWANPGNWVSPMGGAGGTLATVQSCQSQTTYEITYYPTNSFGQVIGTQNLFVVVQ